MDIEEGRAVMVGEDLILNFVTHFLSRARVKLGSSIFYTV